MEMKMNMKDEVDFGNSDAVEVARHRAKLFVQQFLPAVHVEII